MKPRNEGVQVNSKVFGRVVIDQDITIESSTVIGPCIIGRDCNISDAYIGPFTSINDGYSIRGTEIEDSVIMAGSSILNADRVQEALIGKDVRINQNGHKPMGNRFVVGDNLEITL